MAIPRRQTLLGILAAILTIIIWGGAMVTARFGVTTDFTAFDTSFLRYVVPGIVFLPVMWRERERLRSLDLRLAIIMAIGAGVPGSLISMYGMNFAPSADMAVLQPGSMPVFVAILATMAGIERMSRLRAFGIFLVFLAVGGLGLSRLIETDGAIWLGLCCFLFAAFLWAAYTVALYRSGLGPMLAAGLVSCITAAIYAPFYFLFCAPRLASAPFSSVLLLLVVLGLLSGALALYTYGYAVRHLGAVSAASFTALTPGAIAFIGWLALDEPADWRALLALAFVTIGIACANLGQGRAASDTD